MRKFFPLRDESAATNSFVQKWEKCLTTLDRRRQNSLCTPALLETKTTKNQTTYDRLFLHGE